MSMLRDHFSKKVWVHGLMVSVLLIAGCGPLRELAYPPAPSVTGEWVGLLAEIRVFERELGFAATGNFAALAREQPAFAFCGHASPLILPYSYEDPAITWLDAPTEQECRARSHHADVYFGVVEARGESATPVTPAMLASKLDRFIYLVLHEDCHDQFDLPFGIEEALCNLITYKSMAAFTAKKYGYLASEYRAVQHYADTQSDITRATIACYEQLAALYARYERGEIPVAALLGERAAIFRAAQKPLAWKQGDFNNVRIANHMTYSRYYPFLEGVFDALDRDPARMVGFFRQVDALKPLRAAVIDQQGIDGESSVQAIRAYEAAMMETISAVLAEQGGRADAVKPRYSRLHRQ